MVFRENPVYLIVIVIAAVFFFINYSPTTGFTMPRMPGSPSVSGQQRTGFSMSSDNTLLYVVGGLAVLYFSGILKL